MPDCCEHFPIENDNDISNISPIMKNIRVCIGASPYTIKNKNEPQKSIVNNKRFSEVMAKHGLPCPKAETLEKWLKEIAPEQKIPNFYEKFIEAFSDFFQIEAKWLFQDDEKLIKEKIQKKIRIEVCGGSKDENHNSSGEIYNTLRNYAVRWKKNNYSYDLVENFGKNLKLFTTAHQKIWDDKDLNQTELALLLMISIHFNAGWEKWVPKNINNQLALHSLFIGLHVPYWRTRFRILYSLEFFNIEDINIELSKVENQSLSDKTQMTIKNYVFSKKVIHFLHNVVNSAPEYIASRSEDVLIEISSRWKDSRIDDVIPL